MASYAWSCTPATRRPKGSSLPVRQHSTCRASVLRGCRLRRCLKVGAETRGREGKQGAVKPLAEASFEIGSNRLFGLRDMLDQSDQYAVQLTSGGQGIRLSSPCLCLHALGCMPCIILQLTFMCVHGQGSTTRPLKQKMHTSFKAGCGAGQAGTCMCEQTHGSTAVQKDTTKV